MSKLSSSPTSKDSNFFKQQLMSDSLQNGQCLTKKKKKKSLFSSGKRIDESYGLFQWHKCKGNINYKYS